MGITQSKNLDFLRIIKIVFKVSAFYLKYTKYIQNPKLPLLSHMKGESQNSFMPNKK